MKHILRGILLCLSFFSLSFVFFTVPTYAAPTDTFRIYASEDAFVLSQIRSDGEYVLQSGDLGTLMTDLSKNHGGQACSLLFDHVVTKETLTFTDGIFHIQGELTLTGDARFVISEDADVTLGDLSLSFADGEQPSQGYIRVKDGHLSVNGATVRGGSQHAICMDYASGAELTLYAGHITGNGDGAVLYATRGTVRLLGGCVESTKTCAVYSSASLFLSGTVQMHGVGTDILTEGVLWLSCNDVPFCGDVTIRSRTLFEKGEARAVLYGATSGSESHVTYLDRDGEVMPLIYMEEAAFTDERHVVAVYRPFTVQYMWQGKEVANEALLFGASPVPPLPPIREGYTFVGWYLDAEGTAPLPTAVHSDIAAYAVYRLTAPVVSLSSLSFVYDGHMHSFGCDTLTHPLLDKGVLTYSWQKDGTDLASVLPALSLCHVGDSGVYRLTLTLTVDSDSVTVTTPPVTVSVSPKKILPPMLSSVPYSGTLCLADVPPSAAYTVTSNEGGITVGTYPVILALTDPHNTVWAGHTQDFYECTFSIIQADNVFVSPPAVNNAFAGHTPQVTYVPRFGEGVCLYASEKDGTYTEDVPVGPGTFFVRVCVEGTENYTALVSDPMTFVLYEVRPEALRLLRGPSVSTYVAFDVFLPEGMQVAVTMTDGTQIPVPNASLAIEYVRGRDSLRFGDAFVFLKYEGLTLPVPVTVEKAVYDLSGVTFGDCTYTYNGTNRRPQINGVLPTGKDGIPLRVDYEGGGCGVGEYTAVARFVCESDQYEQPAFMTARVTVTPCPVTVLWGSAELTYNGTWQAPVAYGTNIDGAPLPLTVTGHGCTVSDAYVALCSSDDGNYAVSNATCPFFIKKAVYDMQEVRWSASEFVYDGHMHTVTLLGLPQGVTAVGYGDASAVTAGTYTPTCTLSYDALNYEAPTVPAHTFSILPTSYDMSGVQFLPTVRVYNGTVQYPEQTGRLPIGADGSTPTYIMDAGACHVSDGTVTVTVHFATASPNYLAPPDMVTSVTVVPCPMEVVWSGDGLIYNGSVQTPSASSDICDVHVTGGRMDAGTYTATAHAADADYTIVNSLYTYTISPAADTWVTPLEHPDVYEGHALAPTAQALHGSVTIAYFFDAACTVSASQPLSAGTYYAVATASGDKNHTPLIGDTVMFSVMPVVPVGLLVQRTDSRLFAMTYVCAADVNIVLLHNDGSTLPVSFSDVTIDYPQAAGLRATDTSVIVRYGTLATDMPVTVERITVPLPATEAKVYNGQWQYADITPSALYTVQENTGGKTVGSYDVHLSLTDADNYCFPDGTAMSSVTFDVLPRPLSVTVEDVPVYLDRSEPEFVFHVNGDVVGADELGLTFSLNGNAILAGAANKNYAVTFELGQVTPVGTLSPEGKRTAYILALIFLLPLLTALIVVRTEGRRRLAFAARTAPSADMPSAAFTRVCSAPAVETRRPQKEFSVEFYPLEKPVTSVPQAPEKDALQATDERHTETLILPFEETETEDCATPTDEDMRQTAVLFDGSDGEDDTEGIEEACLLADRLLGISDMPVSKPKADVSDMSAQSVDAARADALLTDTMAHRLVEKQPICVTTHGSRKVILNVGLLNKTFEAGERVDVNVLKEKYLIPYDTGYLKILADGYLDRALEVYADSFSLQAVKMIALTGGHAYKVKTVRLPVVGKAAKTRRKK